MCLLLVKIAHFLAVEALEYILPSSLPRLMDADNPLRLSQGFPKELTSAQEAEGVGERKVPAYTRPVPRQRAGLTVRCASAGVTLR
jgi:hypothetical protein